jgi:hypothetical protein
MKWITIKEQDGERLSEHYAYYDDKITKWKYL